MANVYTAITHDEQIELVEALADLLDDEHGLDGNKFERMYNALSHIIDPDILVVIDNLLDGGDDGRVWINERPSVEGLDNETSID